MRSAPVVIKLEGGAIFHCRERMVPIGSEDLRCDFSNDPDQESIRGAAEQSAVFQNIADTKQYLRLHWSICTHKHTRGSFVDGDGLP
jgi:hypothetical protein